MAFWSTFGPQLAQSGLHAFLPDVFPSSAPQQPDPSATRGMLGIRNVMGGWPGMVPEDAPTQPINGTQNQALGNVAPMMKRGT